MLAVVIDFDAGGQRFLNHFDIRENLTGGLDAGATSLFTMNAVAVTLSVGDVVRLGFITTYADNFEMQHIHKQYTIA